SSEAEQLLAADDAAGSPSCLGIDREREAALERQFAFDAETEREPYGLQFSEAETAKLGIAEAKVGKPEQGVAVRIQFGRQPCRGTHGIEQLAYRRGVRLGSAGALGGAAGYVIGAQRQAKLGRKQDHAAILSAC